MAACLGQREGPLLSAKAHVQLIRLCDQIAEDAGTESASGAVVTRSPSDAYAARAAGLPAVTITCRGRLGYAEPRVDERAIERAEAFCTELIGRIDAELGPDLPAPAEEPVVSEPEGP